MHLTAFDIASRFVGVREVDGAASNEQVLAMLRLDAKWPEDDEVAWCFTGDVEILTAKGFVRFDALPEGLPVAQVDPFLGVSFDLPTRYIHKKHQGPVTRIESRDFSFGCDPEHRFLGLWNQPNLEKGSLELRPLVHLTSSLAIPPVCTSINFDDEAWSDRDLALLAAFLSDGFFAHGHLTIQVSKERKLQALRALDPRSIYEAKKVYGPYGVQAQTQSPLTTFEFDVPEVFSGIFTRYKLPKWTLLAESWSRRQLMHFVHAYVGFDGSTVRGGSLRIYSSDPELYDWLQAAVVLSGSHSSRGSVNIGPFSDRPCTELVFCPEKQTRTLRPEHLRSTDEEVELHCVEVPTGVIVIRDPKGTVIPVGNCSAFVNYVCWLLRLPRSKSLSARSWLAVGRPIGLEEAEAGFDVVVLRRGPNAPDASVLAAPGHVGFFAGLDPKNPKRFWMLGGNQGDSVSVSSFDVSSVLGVRRLYVEGVA